MKATVDPIRKTKKFLYPFGSAQYVSNSKLGNISPSPRLEQQLASALERIISDRREDLLLLEADSLTYRGRLLEAAEDRFR